MAKLREKLVVVLFFLQVFGVRPQRVLKDRLAAATRALDQAAMDRILADRAEAKHPPDSILPEAEARLRKAKQALQQVRDRGERALAEAQGRVGVANRKAQAAQAAMDQARSELHRARQQGRLAVETAQQEAETALKQAGNRSQVPEPARSKLKVAKRKAEELVAEAGARVSKTKQADRAEAMAARVVRRKKSELRARWDRRISAGEQRVNRARKQLKSAKELISKKVHVKREQAEAQLAFHDKEFQMRSAFLRLQDEKLYRVHTAARQKGLRKLKNEIKVAKEKAANASTALAMAEVELEASRKVAEEATYRLAKEAKAGVRQPTSQNSQRPVEATDLNSEWVPPI